MRVLKINFLFVFEGMLYYGGIAAVVIGGGVGLWFHDQRVSKRLLRELPELKAMHVEAATLAATASDEPHFTVNYSEKGIFQLVCGEIEWNINQREQYFDNGIPILRSLLPPSKSEEIMAHVLWKIAFENDGDFYDSYLEFYMRRIPNSVGSVVYQEMMKSVQDQN